MQASNFAFVLIASRENSVIFTRFQSINRKKEKERKIETHTQRKKLMLLTIII